MYTALYRAYRPEVFEEVLGQEHIVKILKNQIATGSTSHAYLFCGTRGTGKTTTARLLAKGLNCLNDGERPCGTCSNCRAISEGNFIDVIEIDAASNNGVENIRELRESVNYPPAVGRKKVYIIDEVHMLSTGAFNALLKTLEEPPDYVLFILATTEVQKLPATILSRCMRLDFKRVPENTLITGLADICGKIGIDVSEDALRIIAANADGSVRDALSILDQCISGGDKVVGEKDVLEFLGASGDEVFIELTDLVRKRKTSEAIEYLADILSDGKDVKQFIRDWINHYRNLLLTKFVKEPTGVLNMSSENIARIQRQSNVLELEDINRGILELSKASNEARWSTQPRILLELSIVKLCMGAGEIRRATEFVKVDEPVVVAVKQAKAPEAEEIPAEEPPVEEAPAEETPEPETPPVEEAPVEEAPAEETSVEEAPKVEETPAEEPSLYDAATVPVQLDCKQIWDDVFRDGEAEKGSFFLIRKNGILTSIEENSFTVVVENAIIKQHVEKNRKLLEDLMEKHTGKRRTMNLSVKESDRGQLSIEDIAKKAGDVLGVHVDIE